MKTERSIPQIILAVVLCCVLIVMQVACSANTIQNVIGQISAQIPAAIVAADAISAIVAPELVPFIGGVGAIVQADLGLLKLAIADYQAAPETTKWQKVVDVIGNLVTRVDAQLLALNQVKSGSSQEMAMLSMAALSTVLHIMDGLVTSTQSKAQAQKTAALRQIKLREVLPLLDRQQLEAASARNGVRLSAALSYQQALGF